MGRDIKWLVQRNVCSCHPSSCNCKPYVIIQEKDGKMEKVATGFDKLLMEKLCKKANK